MGMKSLLLLVGLLSFTSISKADIPSEPVRHRTSEEIASLARQYCHELNEQDGFNFRDLSWKDFNGYHRRLLNACELGINLQLAFGGTSPTVDILNQCDKMYDSASTGQTAQFTALQRERCRDGISRAIIISQD